MRHASAKSSLSQNAAVQEDGVVEGFRVDDPKVLRMELEDAYNLMAVSRMKLIQYLKIMRKHIPRNQRVPDELHQAVDGVEELCSLLKMPKYQCLFNNSGPVDKALEASDEATEEPTISIRRQPPNTLDLVHTFAPEIVSALNSRYEVPDNRINKNASRLFTNNSKEVEMNVFHEFKKCVFDESNAPASDPAGDRRNSD